MIAAVLEEAGKIVVQDIPDITPGPDEILIKTHYSGICGSDMHTYEGHHPFRKPPVILGHEISGTVAGFGENVEGFSIGDAVTVMPVFACGVCRQCVKEKPNLCLNREMPGVKDWKGTFAEYFISKPAITFKLAEDIDLKTGILAEPLAVVIHSARQAGMRPKSQTLVLGGGPIGILTAAAARIEGAENIVVTDIYDYNLAVAKELSGAVTYNAEPPALVDRIIADYPDRFDTVFLCSSEKGTVKQAMQLADSGAKIVVTGWFTDPVPIDLTEVTLREIEVVGTLAYNPDDFRQALAWLVSGQIPFGSVISHVYSIDQADVAMKSILDRKGNPLKVLLNFDA